MNEVSAASSASSSETTEERRPRDPSFRPLVRPFERSSWARASLQLLTTLPPIAVLLTLMIITSYDRYWITLLLAIPTGAFLLRLFVIQHDCGHGSFVPSKVGNHILGSIFGVLTITPYFAWRQNHATHHISSGNLDKRVAGAEFYTMTVAEYERLTPFRRFGYRVYRSPLLLLVVGGFFAFAIDNRRFAPVDGRRRNRERWSVWGTNLAMLLVAWAVGFHTYVIVIAPLLFLNGTAGVLLFYVQHQFEEAYFVRQRRWSHFEAAFRGSSYLDLPRILGFFTASIGRHHVHHLSTRIPNYRLEECQRVVDTMGTPKKLRLADIPGLLRLGLWDEDRGRLVSFDGQVR